MCFPQPEQGINREFCGYLAKAPSLFSFVHFKLGFKKLTGNYQGISYRRKQPNVTPSHEIQGKFLGVPFAQFGSANEGFLVAHERG